MISYTKETYSVYHSLLGDIDVVFEGRHLAGYNLQMACQLCRVGSGAHYHSIPFIPTEGVVKHTILIWKSPNIYII